MAIPKYRHLPIGGKVPYKRQLHHISAYKWETDYLYTLRSITSPNREFPRIHHMDILKAMEKWAIFDINDLVVIDQRLMKFKIYDRRWNFKLGSVTYIMCDIKRVTMLRPVDEEEILKWEEAARADQDIPLSRELGESLGLSPDW